MTKRVSTPHAQIATAKPFRFSTDRPRRFPGDPLRHPEGAPVKTPSRRIDDLARRFNCFGYFDDNDSPRAA